MRLWVVLMLAGLAASLVTVAPTARAATPAPVHALGDNEFGQLGDGTTTDSPTPVQVSGLTDAVDVAAGQDHTLAVLSDGSVWAWGYNAAGQLGNGTTTHSSTPVQVSGLTGAIGVAGGAGHSLALLDDGSVWAWGNNDFGQLGDGTTETRTTPVPVLGGAVAVAAGSYHSLAVRSDGTVSAWGVGGALGDGDIPITRLTPVQVKDLAGAVDVAAGSGHSLAVRSDGTVWAWGDNHDGQLGDGTTASFPTPVQVSGLDSAVTIASGLHHGLAALSDGTVWAWGWNVSGQLGDGTTTDSSTPVQVSGLTDAVAVAAGNIHSLAVLADGTAWGWGENFAGQLGDGTTIDRTTPVQVLGLPVVASIAGGQGHTVAAAPATVLEPEPDPDPPTLWLRAIEVNQALQTWRNTVPLYEGKDTVARVFLEKLDDTSPDVATGVLHGTVNGTPLDGSPLRPVNGPLQVPVDVTALDDPETEDVDEFVRAQLDGSLNFVLPRAWTKVFGQMELEFELTNPVDNSVVCEEPDLAQDCAVRIGFVEPTRPLMEFISVPYDRNEIYKLDIDADAEGEYRLTWDGQDSDPISSSASPSSLNEQLKALTGISKRLTVEGRSRSYRITFLRGKDEPDLGLDTSLLTTGSASLNKLQDGGLREGPTQRDLMEQVRRHSDALPTDVIDRRLSDARGFSRAPRLNKANTRLSLRRFADRATKPKKTPIDLHLSGMLLDRGPEGAKAGLAWGWVANTYLFGGESETAGGGARQTSVHEAGHLYGKAHALYEKRKVLSFGVCGSKGSKLATLHPFFETLPVTNSKAIESEWSNLWPTIGPLGEPDSEVWGFSPRALANGYDALTIVNPRETTDIMSYCDMGIHGQATWPSTFTYADIRQGFIDSKNRVPEDWDGTHGAYIMVPGSVDESTGDTDVGAVLPVSGGPPGADPGNVTVTLLDASGSALGSTDVELEVYGEGGGYGTEPTPPSFVAPVPVPATDVDVAEAVVEIDGIERARVAASANAPTIELLSPTASTSASGTIPISWDASDADGDPLTITIQYSLDDGATWEVLGFEDEGGTSWAALTRFLEGSDAARIRVTASDGLRTAVATSETFTVDAGEPIASIETPSDGATPTGPMLALRGDAWDPGDGLLEGESLAWTSDIDGSLGSGNAVDIMLADLTAGCHRITLTASDVFGNAGQDVVTIDVGAVGGCEAAPDPGTIVVERTTSPSGGPVGSYTSDLPGLESFALPDSSDVVASDIPAGTYTVTETDPGADHVLASLSCDDPDGGTSTDLVAGTAIVNLDPGEVVICHFIAAPAPANTSPTASDDAYATDEDTVLNVTSPGVLDNDTDVDGDTLTATLLVGPDHGTLTFAADGSFEYTPEPDFHGTDSFTYRASDEELDSNEATVTITVDPVNDAPVVVSVSPAGQTVDHSDGIVPVTVIARDVDGDALTLAASGLPDGVAASSTGCTSLTDGSSECTWTLSGVVDSPAGVFMGTATVSDGELSDDATVAVTVEAEDATVAPDEDNPVAVQVAQDGGASGSFTLSAIVGELVPDQAAGTAAAGGLSTAVVSMSLVPVGPGSTVGPVACANGSVEGTGYDQQLTATCDFDDVEVNTYTVEITVDGGYWTGAGEDVLTVSDPSLGSATGGGTFYWPGTADPDSGYLGDRTNFGFTMSYNKKGTNLRGSLLVIRHLPDGTTYRVKSNALDGLALGEDPTVPMGWASFSGKATYLQPGWDEPEGNHAFTVYVEDHDEPGTGTDRFWLQTRDKDGQTIGAFSLAGPAADHAQPLTGGNIVVPHR